MCAFMGFASSLATAFAILPTALGRVGWLAWPPSLLAVSTTSIMPFSPMPITASGCVTPGNTPSTTAPPSSTTKAGFTPCCFK